MVPEKKNYVRKSLIPTVIPGRENFAIFFYITLICINDSFIIDDSLCPSQPIIALTIHYEDMLLVKETAITMFKP